MYITRVRYTSSLLSQITTTKIRRGVNSVKSSDLPSGCRIFFSSLRSQVRGRERHRRYRRDRRRRRIRMDPGRKNKRGYFLKRLREKSDKKGKEKRKGRRKGCVWVDTRKRKKNGQRMVKRVQRIDMKSELGSSSW